MPVIDSTTISAITTFDDLSFWARGSGLEIVLLVTGSVLFVRLVHWTLAVATRPTSDSDRRVRLPTLFQNLAAARAIGWLVSALVSVVAGSMVAERLGVPLATLVPTATVVGVAVGFGAQRVVADVVSGFFLLAERQLNIGDVVMISAPGTVEGVSGTVEEVTLRVTRLRTVKGEVVFVPNGEIRQVTNLSMEWARLVIDVPLRPEDDVNLAIEVLRSVCDEMAADESWTEVLLEGPEVLGVQAINVGVVQVRIVARVRAAVQWTAGRELRRRISFGLVDAGMEQVRPLPPMPGVQ